MFFDLPQGRCDKGRVWLALPFRRGAKASQDRLLQRLVRLFYAAREPPIDLAFSVCSHVANSESSGECA